MVLGKVEGDLFRLHARPVFKSGGQPVGNAIVVSAKDNTVASPEPEFQPMVMIPDPGSFLLYYEKVAKAAAERQMLVDFHGSYKPSGLRRAYPNVITREGVKGLEQHKWEGQFANPEYDVEIPFIRMLAGPMDYTPGAMRNAQKQNYYASFERPMSLGTRCHQLAMYLVYESPLQMLADSPSLYRKENQCMKFLSQVPTVWDETQVLDARFGEYVAIARQHGEEWYVGILNGWDAMDMELDFSFLEEGTYNMEIYRDGPNAERYAIDFQNLTQSITSTDRLTVHLASGGGWVARIYR